MLVLVADTFALLSSRMRLPVLPRRGHLSAGRGRRPTLSFRLVGRGQRTEAAFDHPQEERDEASAWHHGRSARSDAADRARIQRADAGALLVWGDRLLSARSLAEVFVD
jgi:hypothetical protein